MQLNEVVEKVSFSNGWVDIETDGHSGFGYENKYELKPKVGDRIIVYTVKGSTVRGVTLNGILLYYKTDQQLDQEHKEWCEKYEREKLEKFIEDQPKMDAAYDGLPECFKKRIDKFRLSNPKFRIDYEAYELFCCQEAVKIADALKAVEAIKDFYDLPWGLLKEAVNISDDHSGNTFGMACSLAILYLQDKDYVVNMCGALAPLVGSAEYGG